MIYITEKRSELNIIVPDLASQAAELEPVTSNESKKHIINQTLSSVSLILHTFAPLRIELFRGGRSQVSRSRGRTVWSNAGRCRGIMPT